MVEPSGKPTLTRISFSWTLASQVILKVGMFSLLCSQNLISASSPPTLKNKIFTLQIPQEIKLIKVKNKTPCKGSLNLVQCGQNPPNFIPGLEDGEQGHVIGETCACKVSMNKAEAFSFIDEGLWETGCCWDGAHCISNTNKNKHQQVNTTGTWKKKSLLVIIKFWLFVYCHICIID